MCADYMRYVQERYVAVEEECRVYGIPLIDADSVEEVCRNGKFLGRGGFGECYLGRAGGSLICVKILHTDDYVKAWEEVVKEARLMLDVAHLPVLVRLVGVCLESRVALVSVYGGQPLDDLLRRGKLSYGACVKIAGQLLDIVESLTKAGLAHGDIKANNVVKMTSSGPSVTLIDLGMRAKFGKVYRWQNQVPKPFYAPELYQGHPTSPESQVYQVGIVVDLLLSGMQDWDWGLCGWADRAMEEVPAKRPTIEEGCWLFHR